jgi:hypothetical protein
MQLPLCQGDLKKQFQTKNDGGCAAADTLPSRSDLAMVYLAMVY